LATHKAQKKHRAKNERERVYKRGERYKGGKSRGKKTMFAVPLATNRRGTEYPHSGGSGEGRAASLKRKKPKLSPPHKEN